jgi:AraC-like DNA-binding protein
MAIASFLPSSNRNLPTHTTSDFSHFAGEVQRLLGCEEVVLATTMPRGGLQICRRLAIHDGLIRRYHAALHQDDRLAWRAIREGFACPVPGDETTETPLAYGFTTVIAIRVESPVFGGYPGVLFALRRRSSTAPVQSEPASQVDPVRTLFARTIAPPANAERVTQPRHFVFDTNGRCIVGEPDLPQLDPAAATRLAELAQSTLKSEDPVDSSGRICVTDSRGVLIPVELNRFEAYPALSDAKVVFVALHPDIVDWSAMGDRTFDADQEASRLTRSVAYMISQFRAGPTLDDIAQSVQLSPFHFHRRFTEVFGVTPKHLLYDLQIDFAKKQLADPNRQLVDIARECGFAHQSHFTSRFKQGAGVTPTRWRRAVLQMPGV